METEGFASSHPHPRGLMTINHLCQQKTFFQFSYQIKTVGNLFGLGAFLVSKLKLSRAKNGRARSSGLRWSWHNGASAIEPHTWLGCGGQVHKGHFWIQMEKVNPPSVFLKTLLILNFQHYSDVNQWISIGPLWGRICKLLPPYLGFPSGSVVKNSPANAGDEGDVGLTLWKILWSRKWQLTPVFLPGKSHGQRSLVGCYSSWGHKELDLTE